MGWRIKAQAVESCSCKMVCRCTLGPAEPDQGWCSAALGFDIVEGDADGVDLAGVKFVILGDLPGDFFGGFDAARLYVDESASDEQRTAVEEILQGKRGGLWEGLREAIRKWLPTKSAAISFGNGDSPSVTVDGVGRNTLQPLQTEDGKRAVLENAPVAAALGQNRIELALATGSNWSDPDMRSWESLGYGSQSVVDWSG